MGRLTLVLLIASSSSPAAAQEADAGGPVAVTDPGTPSTAVTDAGTPPAAVPEGVGRHFAYLWDAEVAEGGASDVQLWVAPRWGRANTFIAVDLRAGVLQGAGSRFTFGFFIDASPSATGERFETGLDARLTLLVHRSFAITERVSWAAQVAGHFGVDGAASTVLLVLDAQLNAVRVGLNLEGYTNADFRSGTFSHSRFRQALGLSYVLSNGFGVGLELQNRLSWAGRTYGGDAFLIGPSVAYRAKSWWVTLTLLPQVAAIKTEANLGGDPLELNDNERFNLRLAMGIVAL